MRCRRPRQVYWASMAVPSAQGAVTVSDPGVADAAEVLGGTVVVTIDSVWLGPAGRSVRPSLEQAPSDSTPRVPTRSNAARRFTALER